MKNLLLTISMVFCGIALFAQTQYEVKYKDLPKETQKYISKNYDGCTIDKAVQGESKDGKMSFCEVYVTKGTEKSKLIFDKNGDFVKKEAVTETAKAPPAPAPAPAAPGTPATVPDTTKKK